MDNYERLVFGLSGSPVATMLTFREFVRPAVYKMMGKTDLSPLFVPASLETSLSKPVGQREILLGTAGVRNNRLVVKPVNGQRSDILDALAAANCSIHLPASAQQYAENDLVNIEFLHWN